MFESWEVPEIDFADVPEIGEWPYLPGVPEVLDYIIDKGPEHWGEFYCYTKAKFERGKTYQAFPIKPVEYGYSVLGKLLPNTWFGNKFIYFEDYDSESDYSSWGGLSVSMVWFHSNQEVLAADKMNKIHRDGFRFNDPLTPELRALFQSVLSYIPDTDENLMELEKILAKDRKVSDPKELTWPEIIHHVKRWQLQKSYTAHPAYSSSVGSDTKREPEPIKAPVGEWVGPTRMAKQTQNTKELNLTVSEAASALNCSEETVRRMIHSKRLRAFKLKKDWRIPESAVAEAKGRTVV